MDSGTPPPADRLFEPIRQFAEKEAAGGILLVICTIIAMIWANSPWSESYFHLWETKITVGFQNFNLTEPLHLWINDGLMAVFFFVVGLEIKREILVGELSNFKQAILPIAGAFGGMVVPALLFTYFNYGLESSHGWGIPMATDIAFAVGILALLGKRVPLSLKVFLTALAIADDIGAVLVIALFYTSKIVWFDLFLGAGFLGILVAGNWAGIRNPIFYGIFGIGGLWIAFLLSGVHATVAGVLAAFAIPARTRINARDFLKMGRVYLNDFETADEPQANVLSNRNQLRAINHIASACEHAQTPLQRLEHALHPYVTFFIMPLFALANAGVAFTNQEIGGAILNPISLGILSGLFLGKQVGIFSFTWLVVKLKWAELPSRIRWRHIYGTAILGGIGFTMSLFVTDLAFKHPEMKDMAKIGIFVASLLSAIVGLLVLKAMFRHNAEE